MIGPLFMSLAIVGPLVLPGTGEFWSKVGFVLPVSVGLLLSVPAYLLRPASPKAEATLLQLATLTIMLILGGLFCFWLSFEAKLNRAEFGFLISFVGGMPATVITWRNRW